MDFSLPLARSRGVVFSFLMARSFYLVFFKSMARTLYQVFFQWMARFLTRGFCVPLARFCPLGFSFFPGSLHHSGLLLSLGYLSHMLQGSMKELCPSLSMA